MRPNRNSSRASSMVQKGSGMGSAYLKIGVTHS
jgi:hypothetical protein